MSGEYPGPRRRGTADIVFTATMKADELRFLRAPEESVEFTGDAGDESTSGSVRTNLPDEVAENTTYRDVHVDYAIAAKLADAVESGPTRTASRGADSPVGRVW